MRCSADTVGGGGGAGGVALVCDESIVLLHGFGGRSCLKLVPIQCCSGCVFADERHESLPTGHVPVPTLTVIQIWRVKNN